jgi:hypothetical protein
VVMQEVKYSLSDRQPALPSIGPPPRPPLRYWLDREDGRSLLIAYTESSGADIRQRTSKQRPTFQTCDY